jgi:hypothetical protein
MSTLLSVSQLNQLSCSQTHLQLLRCLFTSDLAFSYMLLEPATLQNIAANCRSLFAIELEEGCHCLTEEQCTEFDHICSALEEYAANY